MTRILHRSLSEARHALDAPYMEDGAVVIAAHEAGHATAALALGYDVTELEIHLKGNRYGGHLSWDYFAADMEERAIVYAAGVASLDLLGCVPRGLDPWYAGDEDARRLREEILYTTSDAELDRYRARAVRLLEANTGTLDRFTVALLLAETEMTEAEIRAIARPGMAPDEAAPMTEWTSAQRHAMADRIEAMVRGGNVPPRVRELLNKIELMHNAGKSTASGLRHGDALPIVRTVPEPRTSAGYQHRALIGGL